MRMLKFWAWLFLIYGIVELSIPLFIDLDAHTKEMVAKYGQEYLNNIIPSWKRWFTALTSIIGSITILYFIAKIKRETEKSSPYPKLLREGTLYSAFMIGIGAQMLVVDFEMKILSTVFIVIGIIWNYLCVSLLRKIGKEPDSESE